MLGVFTLPIEIVLGLVYTLLVIDFWYGKNIFDWLNSIEALKIESPSKHIQTNLENYYEDLDNFRKNQIKNASSTINMYNSINLINCNFIVTPKKTEDVCYYLYV